jgi:four helix bundle protein
MQNSTNKTIKSFTDLVVWREGHKLAIMIYKTTNTFPKEETYSLTDQIRRCAVSITSNIAEGFGRQTYKEKVQYYYQAQGSLTELKNQLLIARDVDYLPQEDFKTLADQAVIVSKLLGGLIRKSKTFKK